MSRRLTTHRWLPALGMSLLFGLPVAAQEPAEPAAAPGPSVANPTEGEVAILMGVVVYGEEAPLAELAEAAAALVRLAIDAAADTERETANRTYATMEALHSSLPRLWDQLVGSSEQDSDGEWVYSPGAIVRLIERLDELAERDGQYTFTMLFSPVGMRINVQNQSMIWTTLAGEPVMAFADHPSRRIVRAGALRETRGLPTTRNDSEPRAQGEWKTIAGFEAQRYKYGPLKMTVGPIPIRAKLTMNGTIWLAPDHPARSIVAQFYQHFGGAIQRSGWLGELAFGLMLNMMKLSAEGLPLEGVMSSTTTSMAAPIVLPAATAFQVVAAGVVPADEALLSYVRGSALPEDYELVEMPEQDLPDMSQPVREMRRLIREDMTESGAGRLFRRTRERLRRNRERDQPAEGTDGAGQGTETGDTDDGGAEEADGGEDPPQPN